MRLNKTTYNNTWIDYNEIQKGGSLHPKMDSMPNKDFGNSTSSKPFSLTNDN
jgi:putative alpha-1,2-mannosidase